MGRALAVSKVQSIKTSINTIDNNLKLESQAIQSNIENMMQKRDAQEIDTALVEKMSKKANEVVSKIPLVNKLEEDLEI